MIAAVRRSVPDPLVPAVVRIRSRLAARGPDRLAAAREQMAFLLERTRPEVDLDEVAERHLEFSIRRSELRWHPRLLATQPVVGVENVLAAQEGGRGVILNFMHHGQYSGFLGSLLDAGIRGHAVVRPQMLDPHAAPMIKADLDMIVRGGGLAISSDAPRTLIDELRKGAAIAIATDVPGPTLMTMYGRQVMGSPGAARLAIRLGVPVVLAQSKRSSSHTYFQLSEPMEPAEAGSEHDLLQEMARRQQDNILEWPEAADHPLFRWGVPDHHALGTAGQPPVTPG